MKFLGLRLCEHDSNITLTDGTNVKYYSSERDNQIKHHGFEDLSSWKKVFDTFKVSPKDIDAIGIVIDCYRHEHIKCDENKLYEEIDIPIFKMIGFDCPVFRVDHHYVHALSIWTLGVETTTDFIFDGFGDDQISHTIFKQDQKVLVQKLTEGYNSLGQTMAMFGAHIGLSGDKLDIPGKVMALKAYGQKSFIHDQYSFKSLIQLWSSITSKDIENCHEDEVATHIRKCHEETERIFVEHFKKNSKASDVIGYSGGVAQNTIINSKIKKVRPNLHIPPHCNDCGLSLGIVEFLRKLYDQEPFDVSGFPFWQSDISPEPPSKQVIKNAAEHLAKGNIIGWYQGHGEVGPRALGNRSILMRPDIKDGKEILNSKVKHRESFRPFGASVLRDKVSEYFDWNEETPFMLYVMDVLDKNSFPSITHEDGTCRPQTVTEDHEVYYELISEFEKLTGIPMLLNTSLNNGGKPICGSPNEALELFCASEMDNLVVGNTIYSK
jgi:carbamoyltransferase